MKLRARLLFLLPLFLACAPESKKAETRVTYYADVKPVMDAKCTACHVEGGIAPLALDTYDSAYAYRDLIDEQVRERLMPPWLAAPGHREYKDDFSLTDAELELIRQWVRTGAASGTPGNMKSAPPLRFGLPRVDISLSMEKAYTPSARGDDYRCFVIDLPNTETVYVTGFDAKPGNAQIVHHLIAYLAYPEGATYATANDVAESGQGYTCFGGPGKIGATDYDYTSLGGWGPGGSAMIFPAGTGVQVPPGSKVVLQIHYSPQGGTAASDQTTIELQTASEVDKEGFFIPWLNPYWVLTGSMPIPAGNPAVEKVFEFDPTLFTIGRTPIVAGQSFRLYSAGLHMHLLGSAAELYIMRKGRAKEMLLEIPHWDFHWQRQYFFVDPVRFMPGDRLGIKCLFDNSAENQPVINGRRGKPKDRNWGETTEDEMCVGFFYTTAD